MLSRDEETLSFCHMNLTKDNIIINRDDGTVQGIVNWALSGFFPEQFDLKYYRRYGDTFAAIGEEDDSSLLAGLMMSELDTQRMHRVESISDLVPMRPPNY